MKHKITHTTLLILLGMAVCLNLVPAAYAQDASSCSTAKVAGRWGLTLTGTILLPSGAVPAAAIGRATTDNQGNFTGTEARSVGGQYADETLIGNWTVKSNCTGTLTVNVYESGQLTRTSVLSIVFDDNLNQVRGVQKSLTLPDGTAVPTVITVEGKKLFSDSGDE